MGQHFLDLAGALSGASARTRAGIAARVRVATRRGLIAAGALCLGDAVLTRDNGYCRVAAITPMGFLPCGAAPGSALWLRPDHGVLGRDERGEEVLVPARRLLTGPDTGLARHLTLSVAFERHEIICAEGIWIESAALPPGLEARPRAAPLPAAKPGPMRNFRVAGGGGRA